MPVTLLAKSVGAECKYGDGRLQQKTLLQKTGLPWQQQPPSIVMPVEDMVDASLVGLDQGELVTIPGLHNGDEWTRFEAARRSMLPQFGTSAPTPSYRNQARRSA